MLVHSLGTLACTRVAVACVVALVCLARGVLGHIESSTNKASFLFDLDNAQGSSSSSSSSLFSVPASLDVVLLGEYVCVCVIRI
jgi:hypothetical protein